MQRLVVYTAIIGPLRDQLWSPVGDLTDPHGRSVDYVCYADKPIACPSPWRIERPRRISDDPRRNARWHKLNSHRLFPGATVTLWMDANQQLKTPPWHIVDAHPGPLSTYRHPERSSLNEELKACLRRRKDAPELMRRQVQRYRREGFPVNGGLLHETTVMLRRHTPAVRDFNEAWWTELHRHSVRDQLSFDYVLWRTGLACTLLPGCRHKPYYFDYHPHTS